MDATFSARRSNVVTSSNDGKIVNSSGEFMNIVVMSTSSEMEMLTHSMMSRRNVGRGTNITNKITTTPAASMTSPCRENLP